MSNVKPLSSFWKIIEILKYCLILEGMNVFVYVMTNFISNIYLGLVSMLIYLGLLVIVIRYLNTNYNNSFNLPMKKLTFKDILIDIFLFIIMIGIGYIFIEMIYPMFQIDHVQSSVKIKKDFDALSKYMWPVIFINLVKIGITAPIIEEYIFRGFLFNYFFDHKHFLIGGIVTTLIFASLHPYALLPEFIFQFMSSLPLFFAYYRNLNIKDSILLHSLNNMILVLVFLLEYVFS